MKRLSAIHAELKDAAIVAKIGIVARCFKVEVLPECQPHEERFRCRNLGCIEVLVADGVGVIDPRRLRLRIIGRRRHPGIRRLPQNTIGIDPVARRPSRRQSRVHYFIEVFLEEGDQLAIAWRRCRTCRGKDVDSSPSSHIVRRPSAAAQLVSDKVCRFIQSRTTV